MHQVPIEISSISPHKRPNLPSIKSPQILTCRLRPFSASCIRNPTIYPNAEWRKQTQTQSKRNSWCEALVTANDVALVMRCEVSGVVRRSWLVENSRNQPLCGVRQTVTDRNHKAHFECGLGGSHDRGATQDVLDGEAIRALLVIFRVTPLSVPGLVCISIRRDGL